jgi:DNA-binding MarR family transcriptional regulator
MQKELSPEVETLPGHSIRRLQQIAVAIFLQETEAFGITPIQFAVMGKLLEQPMVDQKTVAKSIGLDTSTVGGVIDRLESRNLVQRSSAENDRRVHILSLTKQGEQLIQQAMPSVLKAQKRILEPLSKKEQVEFLRMLNCLVLGNNDLSRAPTENKD